MSALRSSRIVSGARRQPRTLWWCAAASLVALWVLGTGCQQTPSPTQVCAKTAPKASKCPDIMRRMQREEPEHYACFAKCAIDAPDEKAAIACERTCRKGDGAVRTKAQRTLDAPSDRIDRLTSDRLQRSLDRPTRGLHLLHKERRDAAWHFTVLADTDVMPRLRRRAAARAAAADEDRPKVTTRSAALRSAPPTTGQRELLAVRLIPIRTPDQAQPYIDETLGARAEENALGRHGEKQVLLIECTHQGQNTDTPKDPCRRSITMKRVLHAALR